MNHKVLIVSLPKTVIRIFFKPLKFVRKIMPLTDKNKTTQKTKQECLSQRAWIKFPYWLLVTPFWWWLLYVTISLFLLIVFHLLSVHDVIIFLKVLSSSIPREGGLRLDFSLSNYRLNIPDLKIWIWDAPKSETFLAPTWHSKEMLTGTFWILDVCIWNAQLV